MTPLGILNIRQTKNKEADRKENTLSQAHGMQMEHIPKELLKKRVRLLDEQLANLSRQLLLGIVLVFSGRCLGTGWRLLCVDISLSCVHSLG